MAWWPKVFGSSVCSSSFTILTIDTTYGRIFLFLIFSADFFVWAQTFWMEKWLANASSSSINLALLFDSVWPRVHNAEARMPPFGWPWRTGIDWLFCCKTIVQMRSIMVDLTKSRILSKDSKDVTTQSNAAASVYAALFFSCYQICLFFQGANLWIFQAVNVWRLQMHSWGYPL